MSESTISLKVAGKLYTGWKRIRVSTGIEQLAGDFELECADRWAIEGQPLPLLAGKPCQVLIDQTPVITGWLDESAPDYSGDSHALQLRGRDATGDLVDSAATADGQGWTDFDLSRIAREICKPFGIRVAIDSNTDARQISAAAQALLEARFAQARINPGESAADLLSRAAALRGRLLISDGLGGLLITAAGRRRASQRLVGGVNILGGSALDCHAERYHTYRVVGQSSEADGLDAASAQNVLAEAYDREIRAGRLLIVQVCEDFSQADAQLMAQWVAANRIARGRRAELRVRGWLDGDQPWRPNTLVPVSDPRLRLDGDYLIAAVRFSIHGREGQVTALTVMPPAAYRPAPIPENG